VRFIAPRVSSVDVTGGASGMTQTNQDGILVCSLSLNGAARLVAR